MAIKGLILFLPVSILNSWLVIFKELYGAGDGYWFAVAFPFFVMFFSIVLSLGYNLVRLFFYPDRLTKDWRYIKDNYPQLFEKMYSFLPSRNYDRWAIYYFLTGKYDDGKDEKINQIKFSMNATGILFGIAFFLTIVAIFASMAMIGLKQRLI